MRKPWSFLQVHYTEYREAGGDHAMYVVYNDLSPELGRKIKAEYEEWKKEQ